MVVQTWQVRFSLTFPGFPEKNFKNSLTFSRGNFGFLVSVLDFSVRDSAREKPRGHRQENGDYSLEKNSWCKAPKFEKK